MSYDDINSSNADNEINISSEDAHRRGLVLREVNEVEFYLDSREPLSLINSLSIIIDNLEESSIQLLQVLSQGLRTNVSLPVLRELQAGVFNGQPEKVRRMINNHLDRLNYLINQEETL